MHVPDAHGLLLMISQRYAQATALWVDMAVRLFRAH